MNKQEKEEKSMKAVAFGYKCEECGRGTVVEKLIPEYHTKIKGYPFVVKNAWIGVCNACGAEHFDARETERWERIFEVEHTKHFLTPQEIQRLRKSLGLSMEQFAFLIGCTRQSLYNWLRADRSKPQSRTADLLMKLVRESHKKGEVNVIRFLVQEAEQFGIQIQLGDEKEHPYWEPIILRVREGSNIVPQSKWNLNQMAADTDTREGAQPFFELVSQNGDVVGRLFYDYHTAAFAVEFTKPLGFDHFDVEVRFADGTIEKSESVKVENGSTRLLEHCRYKQVDEIVLWPRNHQG